MSPKNRSWIGLAAVAVAVSFSTASAQGDSGSYGGAEIPVIVTQPQSATLLGEEPHKLSVEAVVSDGGELTYTWVGCESEDKAGCKPLSNTTDNFFYVSGSGVARYYFVEVMSVTAGGGKAWATSDVVKVVGVQRLNAVAPIIGRNPRNESTVIGKVLGLPMLVSAWSSDGGALSYQWFSSANRNDAAGWTPIEGAVDSSFVPDVSKVGTVYYRVEVTNTNTEVAGEKTASKISYAAALRVDDVNTSSAKFPDLSDLKTEQVDTGMAMAVGGPVEFSVAAKSPDGGTLSYQWYRTSYDANVGGVAIEGATDATLVLDAANAPPDAYYYVEVTNTNASVNGEPAAVAASNAKALAAVVGGATAVQTHDRVVPRPAAITESALIAPVTVSTGVLTAGPNPANRGRGAVVFFRQGKRVKGAALSVYDASGNFVKKAAVGGDDAGGQSRRPVGSWDLTDSKGRPVPDGAYLVKGVIKTADGKSEKVSLVVGVR